MDWPQWPRHGAGINNWHLLLGGLNHLLHFCNRIPGKDTWDLYRAKKPLLSITYKVSWTSSDQTGNRQNALSLPVFYQPWMLPLYVVVYCTVLYATLWLEVSSEPTIAPCQGEGDFAAKYCCWVNEKPFTRVNPSLDSYWYMHTLSMCVPLRVTSQWQSKVLMAESRVFRVLPTIDLHYWIPR